MKKFGIYTLDSLDVSGKTVLLRVDINEPIDRAADKITDDTRIRGCVPTIQELRDRGAKVVVMAHQGSDIEYKLSLIHIFRREEHHVEPLGGQLLTGVEGRRMLDLSGDDTPLFVTV